jgi:hypothetical protein
MENIVNPVHTLNVPELRSQLDELSAAITEELKSGEEESEQLELLQAVVANLKEELNGVKDTKKLDSRKQARIAADFTLMTIMTDMLYGSEEDGDFDFEFDEMDDEFEEDEDLIEEDEAEEEKNPKLQVKKGGSTCCNHKHPCH